MGFTPERSHLSCAPLNDASRPGDLLKVTGAFLLPQIVVYPTMAVRTNKDAFGSLSYGFLPGVDTRNAYVFFVGIFVVEVIDGEARVF